MRRGEIIWVFTVCLPRREQANQLNQKRRGFRDNAVSSQLSVIEWSLRWPQSDPTWPPGSYPSFSLSHPALALSYLLLLLSGHLINLIMNYTVQQRRLLAPCFFPIWNEQFGRNFTWCDFADFCYCHCALVRSVRPAPHTHNTRIRSNTISGVHAYYTRHSKQITSLGIPH